MKKILIGLSIGLWIGFVVLLLGPQRASDSNRGAGHSHGAIVSLRIAPPPNAWIPAGDDPYFCGRDALNRPLVVNQDGSFVNDIGSAFVNDIGSAYVNDIGSAYVNDIGSAYVNDIGSAYVNDGFNAPAPVATDLGGIERGFHEFACGTDQLGRIFIYDVTGRRVATYMPDDVDYTCENDNGNAKISHGGNTTGNGKEAFCVVVRDGTPVIRN